MSLRPPLSKSDAQRALIIADVLGVPFSDVLPGDEALPRDVEVLRDGLLALRHPAARIDCHDGGAPFRFLLAQAAVLPGRAVDFIGTPRLGERPHAPLLAALKTAIPALVLHEGDPWPLHLESPRTLGELRFVVDAALSSQFASSLLLAAARHARAGHQASVHVRGAMASEGYYRLTRAWLERTGFTVEGGEVVAPTRAPATFPALPGDWSSLGYLFALSWVSGLSVERVQEGSGHPDEALVSILRDVGIVRVEGRLEGTPRGGFDVDSARCPDAIPTLAVWATRLPDSSRFRHTSILRLKESDRLSAIVELLTLAGARSELEGDTLVVHPARVTADLEFDARGDHRMAMSAAVLARLHERTLRLRGADSVAKSVPGFWAEARKAGVEVESLEVSHRAG